MRFLFAIFYAATAAACPVGFQTQSAANLKPTTTSHTVLLRQSDGSFTGYEMADAPPYGVVSVTPQFQKQLTVCPPPPPTLPVAGPQAFAQLPSGGYLFLQGDSAFQPEFNSHSVNALQFDASMRPVSSANFPAATVEAIRLADLNSDGNPDMIVGTYPAGLQVRMGNGGASFQSPTFYTVSNFLVGLVVVTDLNADHKLDLVVLSKGEVGGGKISVFLGNGGGTFQPEKVVTNSNDDLQALAAGDLNGDGKPDLVFTTAGPQPALIVAMGSGDGTFAAPVSYPSGGGYSSVAIGDVNGDGFPDIVASGISILFGDGTGAFPNRCDYVQVTTGDIILTDFDGDGKTDIVVGAGASWVLSGTAVAVLYGRGDGSFSGAPISPIPGLPNVGNGAIALESADLDGDGIPDLLYADLQTGIAALHGNGDGTFTVNWQATTPLGFVTSIAIGDFNRDSIPDFAANLYASGVIEVFLGAGDGTFQPPTFFALGSLSGQNRLVAADFNNDGKLDLAVTVGPEYSGTSVTGYIEILLGDGKGGFAWNDAITAVPGPVMLTAGDFNNDGVLDLAVATAGSLDRTGSGISILLGKGDSTFSTASSLTFASAGYLLTAADFNLDGKLDLAVLTESSTGQNGIAILLGRGDGGFQPPILYSNVGSGGLAAGDLNGDGIPDLVAGTGYLLGNGDGTFQTPVALGFYASLIADFNGDGQMDLASGALLGVAAMLNVSRSATFTLVSAASFQPGPLAPESLVSAFGSGIGSSASTTSVTVQDALGVSRPAPLLFASPNQVNFEIPGGTSSGVSTVVVSNGASAFSAAAQIAPVAPAMFELNKTGLVAAYVVRVSAYAQTIEPIFTLQNGVAVPAPIDLGPQGDQVYLSLFGTGLRNAPAGQVSVRINGVNATVSYAGPQGDFPGLDQVNVLVPRQLAGAGQAGIVLSAAGWSAPTVYAYFK
ncbi:MAG TPA: FG-GAP-like repeat-containing protein [Bryobacteraceae bacterium]